jgi:hypothetical protein
LLGYDHFVFFDQCDPCLYELLARRSEDRCEPVQVLRHVYAVRAEVLHLRVRVHQVVNKDLGRPKDLKAPTDDDRESTGLIYLLKANCLELIVESIDDLEVIRDVACNFKQHQDRPRVVVYVVTVHSQLFLVQI